MATKFGTQSMGAAFSSLQHPRQIGAPRSTLIVPIGRRLLWAVGGDLSEPVGELGITATLLNETIQPITAIAPALLTTDAQHIELADETTEDDCAVAGL
jgi:hypothetical protein